MEIGGGKALISREWYFVGASYDTSSAEVCVYQEPLIRYPGIVPPVEIHKIKNFDGIGQRGTPLIIAAHNIETIGDKMIVGGHYNGKIDSPRLSNGALNRHEMEALLGNPSGEQIKSSVVGAWDFSLDIESETVSDISPNQLHGETINLPTRGMTGYNWSGKEMSWCHAPAEYGAIHFHDDDLYDAGWDTDFDFSVPESLKSGIYAAHVRTDRMRITSPSLFCRRMVSVSLRSRFWCQRQAIWPTGMNIWRPTHLAPRQVGTSKNAQMSPNRGSGRHPASGFWRSVAPERLI